MADALDTVDVVHRWHRAIWIDHDTPAAVALMHPDVLGHAISPAADIGAWYRDQFPWAGEQGVSFGQPQAIGEDTEVVIVFEGPTPRGQVIVGHRLGAERREVRLVMAMVAPPTVS